MGIQKLTKEQAVIISGFTGILCGEFSDFHADVEKRLGRGVQTFEFGFKEFATEVKKLYEADFIEMGTVDKEQVKAQVVPEGFVLVKTSDIAKLAIAVSRVDLMTYSEARPDSEKLAWQNVANKLEAMIEAQEPAND